ncbi:MAG: CAP domain-containing protein [Chloroflexi bacterium]|nr:CAP domain-containing protein [Chloroflexota bacterium]
MGRLGKGRQRARLALALLFLAAGCSAVPPATGVAPAEPAISTPATAPIAGSPSFADPASEELQRAAELSSRGGARPENTATSAATATSEPTPTSAPPTATAVPPPPPPPTARPVYVPPMPVPQPPPPSPSPVTSQGFSVVAEQTALALVNQERQSRGLAPVAMSEALRQVARAHAADMAKRNYFAHNTPEDLSPFDRMRRAGIDFFTAGEIMGFSAGIADPVQAMRSQHQGMMAEQPPNDGHVRTILNPAFGHAGVGVAVTPDQRIYYVCDFTD